MGGALIAGSCKEVTDEESQADSKGEQRRIGWTMRLHRLIIEQEVVGSHSASQPPTDAQQK